MQSETFEIEGTKRRRPGIPRKWLISRLFELFFCCEEREKPADVTRSLCRIVPPCAAWDEERRGRRNSLSGLKAPN
jgi:hypothetical protein